MKGKAFLHKNFSPLFNRFVAIYKTHKCNNHVSNYVDCVVY
jgi:hypothetical protein